MKKLSLWQYSLGPLTHVLHSAYSSGDEMVALTAALKLLPMLMFFRFPHIVNIVAVMHVIRSSSSSGNRLNSCCCSNSAKSITLEHLDAASVKVIVELRTDISEPPVGNPSTAETYHGKKWSISSLGASLSSRMEDVDSSGCVSCEQDERWIEAFRLNPYCPKPRKKCLAR